MRELNCKTHGLVLGVLQRRGIPSGKRKVYYDYIVHPYEDKLVQCSQGRSEDQTPAGRLWYLNFVLADMINLRKRFASMGRTISRETVLVEIDSMLESWR